VNGNGNQPVTGPPQMSSQPLETAQQQPYMYAMKANGQNRQAIP